MIRAAVDPAIALRGGGRAFRGRSCLLPYNGSTTKSGPRAVPSPLICTEIVLAATPRCYSRCRGRAGPVPPRPGAARGVVPALWLGAARGAARRLACGCHAGVVWRRRESCVSWGWSVVRPVKRRRRLVDRDGSSCRPWWWGSVSPPPPRNPTHTPPVNEPSASLASVSTSEPRKRFPSCFPPPSTSPS